MVFQQHFLGIKTLTIMSNFSVLISLHFDLIRSVKVSGNSDRLPENIKDTNSTLRLYWNTLHVKIRQR